MSGAVRLTAIAPINRRPQSLQDADTYTPTEMTDEAQHVPPRNRDAALGGCIAGVRQMKEDSRPASSLA